MVVINDIELLMRLGRHRILDYILSQCKVAISAVRLSDYSFSIRKEIEKYTGVNVQYVDDKFHNWHIDKRKYLSMSDLSSIYIAMASASTLLVSGEDIYLPVTAKMCGVVCLQFDDFIIATIKDEKTIQLYNLIKVA